jgi:shikimate kinase
MLTPAHNVVLIGMPGAGKSTLGVLLAKAIGHDFIDTDLVIQRQAGMTLGSYLASRGYEALRQLEAEVICALDHAGTVIATGGSAVYSQAAMQHLRANGRVVYLKCALDVLDQRIASMNERGIAAPSGQTLADVQAERIPLYEQYAEITVEVGSENMDSALGKIIQHLNL